MFFNASVCVKSIAPTPSLPAFNTFNLLMSLTRLINLVTSLTSSSEPTLSKMSWNNLESSIPSILSNIGIRCSSSKLGINFIKTFESTKASRASTTASMKSSDSSNSCHLIF